MRWAGDRRRGDERNISRRHRCRARRASRGPGFRSRLELLAHDHFPYPAEVRRTILTTDELVASAGVADLSRLNFVLGELYADAVRMAQRGAVGVPVGRLSWTDDLPGHQRYGKPFLGRRVSCTWQTGEGSVLAAKLGVPVVSDFRPADMAADGNGAPLVPFLDYVLYRHRRYGRVVQNLGGMGTSSHFLRVLSRRRPLRSTLDRETW